MQQLRKHTDNQLERERWLASQASREVASYNQVAWENALDRAGELFLAWYRKDSARVLEIARNAQ